MKGMTGMDIKRNISSVVMAGMLGISAVYGSYVLTPPPQAEASIIGDVIGSVAGAAVAKKQAREYIKYYNNDDKGRQEFMTKVKDQYKEDKSGLYNDRLDMIITSLSGAIASVDPSINDKPYAYYVNDDESFNAFCTLGHNMSVNKGLFSILDNNDEIAVVLGHEMGHGQKDHPAKGMDKVINKQAIASILVSATGDTAIGNAVGSIALNQSVAKTTKKQECEADNLSFEYIIHSNFNPGATAAVWQRVIDKSGNNEQSSLGAFLDPSDHPTNLERRDNYVNKLYEFSGNHVTVKDGTVYVNDKVFTKPAAYGSMSAAERSYFVLGNLAAAYHNGHSKNDITVNNGVVMMGVQPIMTAVSGDEAADVLAKRLQEIK